MINQKNLKMIKARRIFKYSKDVRYCTLLCKYSSLKLMINIIMARLIKKCFIKDYLITTCNIESKYWSLLIISRFAACSDNQNILFL